MSAFHRSQLIPSFHRAEQFRELAHGDIPSLADRELNLHPHPFASQQGTIANAAGKGAHIPGLDIVRFASAVLVMFYHFGWASWVDADGYLHGVSNYRELGAVSWLGRVSRT